MSDGVDKCEGRYFFIVNNKAGGADETGLRAAVEKHLGTADCDFFIRHKKGQSRRDAVYRGLDAGYDIIVAAGGDGTVSKVADELRGTGARLGIVPLGTANLIARSLKIPADVDAAVRTLLDAPAERRLDAMVTGEKAYFSHVSAGVYSRAVQLEDSTKKQRFGRAMYAWNLLRRIRDENAYPFTITLDEQKWSARSSLLLLANVGHVGVGQMQWGEGIRPDDGRLDLCVVRGGSMTTFARMAWQSARGHMGLTPELIQHAVRRSVKIEGPPDMPIRADGKLIGEGSVEITLEPAAVRVITPDGSEA